MFCPRESKKHLDGFIFGALFCSPVLFRSEVDPRAIPVCVFAHRTRGSRV